MEQFKPYIPAEKITPEFTLTSVIIGTLLAVVFGAANAYLGLRVGMTISASIPAAVISMAVIRVLLKRGSILESNMVQTIGSSGESLAAGVIFTIPVIFLWAREGLCQIPSLLEITIISVCGGVLGVLYMIPLRRALIVKEHGVLPYPEGTACADVLLAGDKGGSSAVRVFSGMGISAAFKFVVDGLKISSGVVAVPLHTLKTVISAEVYPSLVGLGYICGPAISAKMFAGGVIGWLVLIPAIVTFGGNSVLFPATMSVSEIYADGGASAIWSSYIRYIGAGAVATGGIISVVKSFPLIVKAFLDAVKGAKGEQGETTLRTDIDLSMRFITCAIAFMILLIWLLPQIPVALLGAVIIVIFGFFFAAVASRMVGLVGGSNNPVSGMAIPTLLVSAFVLKVTGDTGIHGMKGALSIGAIVCIIAAIAGDTSQDLKTGFLLGATPKKQQIGELIGVISSAFAIGVVLMLLDKAWQFGSQQIPAPQATIMKMIIEGVMGDKLPWSLVFIGAFMAIAVECLGISAMPVAIGMYLPLELSTTIIIGGLIRAFADRRKMNIDNGILFCSGMIAGEGLVGILLAVFAVIGIDSFVDISEFLNTGMVGGAVLLALMIVICALAGREKIGVV